MRNPTTEIVSRDGGRPFHAEVIRAIARMPERESRGQERVPRKLVDARGPYDCDEPLYPVRSRCDVCVGGGEARIHRKPVGLPAVFCEVAAGVMEPAGKDRVTKPMKLRAAP